MALLNTTLTTLLPLLPRPLTRIFAMRYVAGESEDEALEVIRNLNSSGFSATLDILGEHTSSPEEIESVTTTYMELYQRIAAESLDCNISLKLTHLGLGFNDTIAAENLLRIVSIAQQYKNFLRIDMENSPFTDRTLELYSHCREQYDQVGFVLQSYLFRSIHDLEKFHHRSPNIRICKGIYHEPESIAYQDKEQIRENFINLVKIILEGQGYAAIATHDIYLLDTLETWILNRNIPRDRYEFQALFGVPMKGRLEELQAAGHKVRIYVPFGKEWYAYAIRRLKENPSIAGYIMKNLLRRKAI